MTRAPQIDKETREVLGQSTSKVAQHLLEQIAMSDASLSDAPRQVTASQLYRLEKCQASMVLPQISSTSEYAERGTQIHKYLEYFVESLGNTKTAKPKLPKDIEEFCAKIDTQEIRALLDKAEFIKLESGYGLSVDDCVADYPFYSRRTGRVYFDAEGVGIGKLDCVFGTVDLKFDKNDILHVYDFKTGVTDYGRPSESLQLLFGALTEDTTNGAQIGFIYIKQDGSVVIDEEFVSAEKLQEASLRIGAISEACDKAYKTKYAVPVEGEHCKYCPSFNFCPAKQQLAAHLESGVLSPSLPTLSVATAPAILEKLEMAEGLLAAIRKQVDAFAEQHPFTATDGALYGPKTNRRESINGDAAQDIIARMFGASVAAECTETTITKTRLGEKLGEYAAAHGLKKKEVVSSAMRALEDGGALKVSISETVGRTK